MNSTMNIILLLFLFLEKCIFFEISEATSGQVFKLKKTRSYVEEKNRISATYDYNVFKNILRNYKFCRYWGVTTTIFNVSESITNFLELSKKYCLVIIADLKTPEKEYKALNGERILFIDVKMQKILETNPLVKILPWNSFGRKNLGYLMAITANAEAIWDFDDDNFLTDKLKFMEVIEKKTLADENFYKTKNTIVNPYGLFLESSDHSWPRGFPLALIKNNNSVFQKIGKENIETVLNSVSIWQSLADSDPDVDAIFRLTKPLNITFKDNLSLIIEPGQYTPLNAQSCIFYKNSYFSLFLPFSVPGRVSDIWRGYIAQIFLKFLKSKAIISSPLVVQKRNAHNYMGDFISEYDLYAKSQGFLDLISKYSDKISLISDMKNIYIDLYEHGFVEIIDVIAVNEWITFINGLNMQTK